MRAGCQLINFKRNWPVDRLDLRLLMQNYAFFRIYFVLFICFTFKIYIFA